MPDLLAVGFDRVNGGFGIERIKDRFDQDQDIHTAVNKALDLFCVSFDQLVKGDGPEGRIIDIRGNGGCPCCRPDGTGDKSRFLRIRFGKFLRGFFSKSGRGHIKLIDQGFHFIISHADTVAVKGIGFNDIRAGFKILAVDLFDDLQAGSGTKDHYYL